MAASNNDPLFEGIPLAKGAQFANADGTTKKALTVTNTNGLRIDSISCASTDSSAVDLGFYLNDGTTDFYLGNARVAAGSGYTTVIKVEALSTLMPAGVPYLQIPAGFVLKVAPAAAVTSGSHIVDVIALGGSYDIAS